MNEMIDDPLKALWRSQPAEVPTMSVSYVRHRASELERAFRVDNFLELSVGAVALTLCIAVIAAAPHVWIRAGVALLLAGIVFSMFQWRRKAAVRRPPAFESVDAGLVFYRRELERKRDIHRTLWRWYLLPMAPGTIVIVMWKLLGDPHTRGTSQPWIVIGLMLVWITIAILYERAKAARCQREIDVLASLDGDARPSSLTQ